MGKKWEDEGLHTVQRFPDGIAMRRVYGRKYLSITEYRTEVDGEWVRVRPTRPDVHPSEYRALRTLACGRHVDTRERFTNTWWCNRVEASAPRITYAVIGTIWEYGGRWHRHLLAWRCEVLDEDSFLHPLLGVLSMSESSSAFKIDYTEDEVQPDSVFAWNDDAFSLCV